MKNAVVWVVVHSVFDFDVCLVLLLLFVWCCCLFGVVIVCYSPEIIVMASWT